MASSAVLTVLTVPATAGYKLKKLNYPLNHKMSRLFVLPDLGLFIVWGEKIPQLALTFSKVVLSALKQRDPDCCKLKKNPATIVTWQR